MFRAILNERKRREIDPTLTVLRESVAILQEGDTSSDYVEERLLDMLDFFETITTVYDQVEKMPTDSLKRMARLGDNFVKLLSRAARNDDDQ